MRIGTGGVEHQPVEAGGSAQKLSDDVIEVRFAHDYKMVHALLLDGLNEPFHEGVRTVRAVLKECSPKGCAAWPV